MNLLNALFEGFKKKENTIVSVFYDRNTKRFLNVRSAFDGGFMVAIAEYYSDSMTTISTVPMPKEYIDKNCELVTDINKYSKYNGTGWKASKTIKKNK